MTRILSALSPKIGDLKDITSRPVKRVSTPLGGAPPEAFGLYEIEVRISVGTAPAFLRASLRFICAAGLTRKPSQDSET